MSDEVVFATDADFPDHNYADYSNISKDEYEEFKRRFKLRPLLKRDVTLTEEMAKELNVRNGIEYMVQGCLSHLGR